MKHDPANTTVESAPNDSMNNANDQDLATLMAQITELETKTNENFDLYMRSKAEAENARRRARLDVENAHKFGQEKLAKDLLEIVDSLEKSIELIDGQPKEGIELTYKLLIDTLSSHGIKVVAPKQEKFDPSRHEALAMQPHADVPANHIIEVIQKGYTLFDRVLRPARVIIAKNNEG